MVDWTSGTADASIAERSSAFLPLRVPGTPDTFKEAPVSGFVTKDISDDVPVVKSTPYNSPSGARIYMGALLNSSVDASAVWQYALEIVGDATGQEFTFKALRRGDTTLERFRIDKTGAFKPGSDNAQSLGTAANRFSTVFAGTGTINTSDEREKTWRGSLTDAEYAAGRTMLAEFGFFQFTDEVQRKGAEGARFHFGVRAQRAWLICAEHGLAPRLRKNGKPDTGVTPLAFLCFDEWAEETESEFEDVEIEVDEELLQPTGKTVEIDGKTLELSETITRKAMRMVRRATGERLIRTRAGYRYGLRVDELNSFLIAVQARRQNEIEARLATLEGLGA